MRRSILFVTLALACGRGHNDAQTTAPEAAKADAYAVYEQLEADIEAGHADDDDRVAAYKRASSAADDGSAGYAFARAALAGRVAELRGAKAGKLVTEAEGWARKSIERDAQFRDRAATQLLGSLYVMAPGRLVEHGDSEDGLEMLEGLVEEKPDIVAYRLRLAQAYAHLGDSDAAKPHLCACLPARDRLRHDEQRLLDALVEEAGGKDELACAAGAAAPEPTG